jgi:hypothetical protein
MARLRAALFVYLRIALDKLPAWSDLGKAIRESFPLNAPETFDLKSLDAFDKQSREDFGKARTRFSNWWAMYDDGENKSKIEIGKADDFKVDNRDTNNNKRDEGNIAETDENCDSDKLLDYVMKIMTGSYGLCSEIELLIGNLKNNYEPGLRWLIDSSGNSRVVEGNTDSAPAKSLRDRFRKMLAIAEAVRCELEEIVKTRPTYEDPTQGFSDVKVLIRKAVDFTGNMDRLFKKVSRALRSRAKRVPEGLD